MAFIISVISFSFSYAQSKTLEVSPFQEVNISPYIEVVFKQSNKESVVIEWSKVNLDKINIEVNKKTLHIYLDDAKIVSKEEEVLVNGRERDRQIYKGTQVSIIVYYKNLEDVEIRGEEIINFEDAINTEDFDLNIYGSPKVYFIKIIAEKIKVAIYGERYQEIKNGTVEFQRYRCYGESEVNAVDFQSAETRIATYGDNHIVVNVSDQLKVSAFGEAFIQYKGNTKV